MARSLSLALLSGLAAVLWIATRHDVGRGPASTLGGPRSETRREAASPTSAQGPGGTTCHQRKVVCEERAFASAGVGALSVRAAFARSGQPAAGVRVDVLPFGDPTGGRRRTFALTSAGGVAVLERVPAGPVWVFAGGVSKYAALEPGAAEEIELSVPEAAAVVVTVVDRKGVAVPAADVWLSAPGSDELGAVVLATGPDGRCRIPAGVGGWVAARASGHAWSNRSSVSDAPLPGEVTISLEAASRSLRGSVTHADGSPAGGAWVACRLAGEGATGPPVVETVAGSDGAFAAAGLRPGSWTVEAWLDGCAPVAERVILGDGEPPPIALVLGPGSAIEGRVTSSTGRPLPRVRVAATAPGFVGPAGETMTSDDGVFRLDHLPRARVDVVASLLAGPAVAASFDLSEQSPLVWEPMLVLGSVLSGVVVDEAGAPRAFARIRAEAGRDGFGWVGECVADRQGRFEFAGVPGPVSLEVEVAGWGPAGATRIEGAEPGATQLVVAIPEEDRPSAFVAGHLHDPEGEILSGAVVTASRLSNPASVAASATSRDADGVFLLGPLPRGAHLVEVVAPSGARIDLGERVLGAGETEDLGGIRLSREGFLKASIVHGPGFSGTPLLTVVDRLGRSVMRLRPVAGFAASGPLAPGSYRLRVGGGANGCPDIAFEIAEGGTTTVEVPGTKD